MKTCDKRSSTFIKLVENKEVNITKLNKELTSELKEQLLKMEKESLDIRYYYIYSYDLNFDNNLYPTRKSLVLYIGEGNLNRLFLYDRPFMKTIAYQKFKNNCSKKVLYILSTRNKDINLKKHAKISEEYFINNLNPLFNIKHSNLYSNINSLIDKNLLILTQNKMIKNIGYSFRSLATKNIQKTLLHELYHNQNISKEGYSCEGYQKTNKVHQIISEFIILKEWSYILEEYNLKIDNLIKEK